MEKLCSGLPRVRYVRLDQPTLTSTKMNIGVAHAQGNILQKLDDDDYYHPDFLQLAVKHLPINAQEKSVVVWCCYLIFLAGEKQLRHSGHGWKTGGTLCFPREMWKRRPFRDIRTGYDSWFLRDHDPNIVRVCAGEHYIVVRHGSNTWTKMSDGDEADNFFRADGPYIRNRSRPSYIQTTIVSIIRCGRSFSERRFCRKPGRQRGVRVLPDTQLG